MGETIEVPIWLGVVAGLLTAWAVLDRLLIPSVRWALRRRAQRAVDRLNEKLDLRIQPFKLTRRQVLIDRLVHDPQVVRAVEVHAEEKDVPRAVAMEQARRYAREIVPSFSAYAYFGFGTRIARRISKALYRVRLGFVDVEALRAVPPQSSVVFVINHRSNMDYLLVTYMAATSSALSYAVGEWAQVWGLRSIIRAMGAYFIRRDSRNALYRKVLSRYVHMATTAGVTQAIFPEGGLSRDGLLRPPKLGLLNYMVQDFDPHAERDIIFVPVGVNYDRVLEDRVLTGAQSGDGTMRPRFHFSPWIAAKYAAKSFCLMLRGRWHRNGYTCVSFGAPISLREVLEQRNVDLRTLPAAKRHEEVQHLANRLMAAIAAVIPALPVSLVATVILDAPEERVTDFELRGRTHALIETLELGGAHVHIPRGDREYAINVGLRMLTLRGLVLQDDVGYRANHEEHALLSYYANAIVQPSPDGATEYGRSR